MLIDYIGLSRVFLRIAAPVGSGPLSLFALALQVGITHAGNCAKPKKFACKIKQSLRIR